VGARGWGVDRDYWGVVVGGVMSYLEKLWGLLNWAWVSALDGVAFYEVNNICTCLQQYLMLYEYSRFWL
jgi:hypothetical protein